jgi:AcrR family transcriptional regulator
VVCPRKHSQNLILDAVERVVACDGVLTVDALVQEANLVKAPVLYSHSSKRALFAAVVMRGIEVFHARSAVSFGGKSDLVLRGRIAVLGAMQIGQALRNVDATYSFPFRCAFSV